MPVREALHRLTAERALTVVAGRSVGIPALSLERLEDLRRVRLEVEGLAAAWAAEARDVEAGERLHRLHDALDLAVVQEDAIGFLRANRALHFTIYAAAGSPVLLSLIEPLWLQISPYFNLLHASGNYVEANRQHRALILAMDRGDAKEARRAIQRDITASTEALRPMLETQRGGEST
jgi:DNA-binding GntR family transcriptional regulator